MPSLKAVPHIPLICLAISAQISVCHIYFMQQGGHAAGEMRLMFLPLTWSPAAVCGLLLHTPKRGPHKQFWQWQYKYMYVQSVCVFCIHKVLTLCNLFWWWILLLPTSENCKDSTCSCGRHQLQILLAWLYCICQVVHVVHIDNFTVWSLSTATCAGVSAMFSSTKQSIN